MSPGGREDVWVRCPSCGKDNRPGSPFCSSCSERMYREGAELLKIRVRTRGGLRGALRNAALAAIAFFLLGSVALLFWPFPQVRKAKTSSSAQSVHAYLESAERSLDQGLPVPNGIIREGDWNRYVQESHPEDSRVMSVYMMRGKVVMVADEQTGPFRIGTRMVLLSSEEGPGLEIDQLWVGHLPLPRFLAEGWARSLANRFNLDLDARVWDDMHLQLAENGQIQVGGTVQGGGNP